jgi:hypothetical protein
MQLLCKPHKPSAAPAVHKQLQQQQQAVRMVQMDTNGSTAAVSCMASFIRQARGLLLRQLQVRLTAELQKRI